MYKGLNCMSDEHPSTPYYPNTQAVYELFVACQNAQELSHATVRHFEADPTDPPALSVESLEALQGLIIDGFITKPALGQSILKYLQYTEKEEEIQNQLKAQKARKKTLSLQHRNAEIEASKSGLFRGKSRREQEKKADRLKKQISTLQSSIDTLQAHIDKGEFSLRQIAHDIQNQPSLKEACWLSANQLVLAWTPSGRFLFEFLSEINPELFPNTPLSHILLYGHHWTVQTDKEE